MKKKLINWLINRLDPNYSIIKASEEYLLKENQVMSDDLQVLVTKPLSYEAIMVKKKWLWVGLKRELFVQDVMDGMIEIKENREKRIEKRSYGAGGYTNKNR